jgi:hypothetical protein
MKNIVISVVLLLIAITRSALAASLPGLVFTFALTVGAETS